MTGSHARGLSCLTGSVFSKGVSVFSKGVRVSGVGDARVPTRDGMVVSDYGERIGVTSREREHHAGVDFRGAVGEPVYAVADGVIERLSHDDNGAGFRGYGNFIVVKHDGAVPVVFSGYGHLDTIGVEVGERVEAGQQIGTIGRTSNGRYRTMPSHLHFEMRVTPPERGRSVPWPGPYGRWDFDPTPWVEARGVVVEGRRWLNAPVQPVRVPREPVAPVRVPREPVAPSGGRTGRRLDVSGVVLTTLGLIGLYTFTRKS